MTDRSLSHLDPFSGTRMVDVSPKEATHRRALARCKVAMKPETTAKVANNAITKGDVLAAARVAGIQAAKRTAELVPMCHPLLVGAVHVDFTIGDDYVEVEAKVEAVDRTGVEMEAMTACAIAALTVYDMCKTTDRTMSIGQLMLWEKTGGSSGVWKRDPSSLRSAEARSSGCRSPCLVDAQLRNGGTEVPQRELRRRLATALGAVLDVAPAPKQPGAFGIQQHDERL